jgi:hypothetical protein
MIMMEIETPAGFVVDRDLFIKQAHVRKHETNGRKVALYLDEVGICRKAYMVTCIHN